MSLLTVVQDAMVRMNLPKPLSAFTNADPTVQQIVSFAQDIGDEMAERCYWRALNQTKSYFGDGSTSLWPLDADFGQMSPGFDLVSASRPNFCLAGPVTNEQMNRLKALTGISTNGLSGQLLEQSGLGNIKLMGPGSLVLNSGPAVQPINLTVWRMIGDYLEMWPALGAAERVTFSYYSKNWVQPAAGDDGGFPPRTNRYAADTDSNVLDEKVQTSGVIWRWLASKGLDYAEEFRRYEQRLDRAAGREGTDRVVSTARHHQPPDDWFPGTITDLTGGYQ